MNPRNAAAAAISQVLRGQSLTAALEHPLAALPTPQDRAFAQALCYGVIRHYYRLNFIAGRLLGKPLKTKDQDIQALILCGIHQLQAMRVKPHAAVSETVAAAARKPWAKSLINAVLRNYQRDAAALDSAAQTDQEARHNHPAWLITRLAADWPEHYLQLLAANDQPAPMTLRVNPRAQSRDAYLALLEDQGLSGDPVHEYGITLEQAVNVEQLPGFAAGAVSVQDGAAQLAAALLDPRPGQRVLDACAAPGGKTAAILERQPDLKVLALDVDPARLQRVQDTLKRLRLTAELLAADASQPATWAQGRAFERILIDAPCSGLGVIRRHPDIKLLRRPEDLDALAELQAKILDALWPLLAPGGVLLYATCSVLRQENEAQIAAFLHRHADAAEITLTADWGQARPHGRQILTGWENMDGFYYAKIGKSA